MATGAFARHVVNNTAAQRPCVGARYLWLHRPQSSRPPPVAPIITPLFVQAGGYRFGLASIALVDCSRPGCVDVRLNVHEVNGKGIPEALSFQFEGVEATLLLAALDGCTGQANAEIEALRAEVRRLEGERDTALTMAEDMERKQAALRAALGV